MKSKPVDIGLNFSNFVLFDVWESSVALPALC